MNKFYCDGCGADITVKHSNTFRVEDQIPGLSKEDVFLNCDECGEKFRDALKVAKKWREEEEGRQRLEKMGMRK